MFALGGLIDQRWRGVCRSCCRGLRPVCTNRPRPWVLRRWCCCQCGAAHRLSRNHRLRHGFCHRRDLLLVCGRHAGHDGKREYLLHPLCLPRLLRHRLGLGRCDRPRATLPASRRARLSIRGNGVYWRWGDRWVDRRSHGGSVDGDWRRESISLAGHRCWSGRSSDHCRRSCRTSGELLLNRVSSTVGALECQKPSGTTDTLLDPWTA